MTTQTDKIIEKAISTGVSQPAILLLSKTVLDLNTIDDQIINLSGGKTYIITDIVITNVSATPITANDGQWYSEPGRQGNQIAFINSDNYPNPCFSEFTSPLFYGNYLPTTFINLTQLAGGLMISYGSPLYFSLGTPEGTPLTCDVYIYGSIIN